MPPPPVEVDPQLAEIEEWDVAELAATIEAFERQKLEELEIEEWEAAALVAMEELEQRTQRRREREHHELHREEMHKRRRVEE